MKIPAFGDETKSPPTVKETGPDEKAEGIMVAVILCGASQLVSQQSGTISQQTNQIIIAFYEDTNAKYPNTFGRSDFWRKVNNSTVMEK
jgi:hypothetical protein